MKRRIFLISGLLLLFAAAGLLFLAQKDAVAPTVTSNEPGSFEPEVKKLDPLEIEAIRSRAYISSDIITEQTLNPSATHQSSVISYTSDGLKVYALLSVPSSARPADGWPVIILNHGYINPAQYQTTGPEYAGFISAFTKAGYLVIKPDYRGHGKSQGSPEGGHFSPVYTYDILNLIESLKKFALVNPARIGTLGHSLGGHLSLRVAVVSEDVKATSIMAGVVGSMNDLFYNWPRSPIPYDQPATLVRSKKAELVEKYGEPKDNPDFWNRASAINYVDSIVGPVQVNHDELDSNVPKIFSDHLVDALNKAGKKYEYHLYPGDDHQFAANRSALLKNILNFYRANL